MEAKLDKLDLDEYRNQETKKFLGSRRNDDMRGGSLRKTLLGEIDKTLGVYGQSIRPFWSSFSLGLQMSSSEDQQTSINLKLPQTHIVNLL